MHCSYLEMNNFFSAMSNDFALQYTNNYSSIIIKTTNWNMFVE